MSRRIGVVPGFIAEAIVVCEILRMVAHLKLDNLLVESESHIVINSILGKVKTPSQIVNYITDIANLTHNFSSVHFIYRNRDMNRLADMITDSLFFKRFVSLL